MCRLVSIRFPLCWKSLLHGRLIRTYTKYKDRQQGEQKDQHGPYVFFFKAPVRWKFTSQGVKAPLTALEEDNLNSSGRRQSEEPILPPCDEDD